MRKEGARRKMLAMVLEEPGQPLRARELSIPKPGPGPVLLHVHACAVCRTDLHAVDGELPHPKLPLTPGCEIIGTVASIVPLSTTVETIPLTDASEALTRLREGKLKGAAVLVAADGI